MTKAGLYAVALAAMCPGSVFRAFTAYNDFGGTSPGNVTAITLNQSGLLKDFGSGANTSVTLAVVAGSPSPAVDTATGVSSPAAGTDAANIFGGIVDMRGYIQYSVTTPNYSSARLDFTGLDPAKTYDLVLTADRNNAPYTTRYTLCTLSDVDAFINSHSACTTVVTVNQPNDSAQFVSGYNTVNGCVVRWTNVAPGTDGDMSVNVTALATSTGQWYLGALRLVESGGGPSQKTLSVKHAPYLQLGDAPLAATGPGIGATDQIVVVWQTVEAGSGTAPDDFFEAQYRRVGDASFVPAGPVSTLNTGAGTRVNYSVAITGLDYNTLYDYQVMHKRVPASPVIVNTYNGTFRTRRPPGDDNTYLFAAHGDSATIHSASELAQFETVNARIAAASAEFVTLLGDNVYDNGSHDEFDARLDASLAPNNSAYIRNHVEYFCNGNHDSGGSSFGIPSLQNYYCPMPVLGVTSPVAPPVGETPEFNYSFDYGLVHFATIDSTSWGGVNGDTAGFISPTRQANILAWLAADMAASPLPWKVVMTHHPPKSIAGHTDTGEGMAAELIPVLVQQNVDLLLVGHSHNYQRSFPLTGYAAGDVTFDMDQSGTYTKGSRVIQVVAGTGGRNIDGSVPTTASGWLAKAYGINNGGKVGPLLVEVSRQQLLVRFTAADNGSVMDEFRVVVPGPLLSLDKSAVNPTAWLGDPVPSDSFTVSNSGAGTLNYAVTENVPWLSVTSTAGSSTGEVDSIQIDYDVAGLTAGAYTGTITVSSPDATNSPKVLTVNLTIQTVRPDFDGDGDVDQDDFGHLQVCLTGSGVSQSAAECQNARLDIDNDVDSADVTLFQKCLLGTNVFPARTCMQRP